MHGMDRKDGYKTQKTPKRTKGQTIKTETNGQFQGTNGHIENQRINIIKDKERVERTKPWTPNKNVTINYDRGNGKILEKDQRRT